MAGPKVGLVSDAAVTSKPLRVNTLRVIGRSGYKSLEQDVVMAAMKNLLNAHDTLAEAHPVYHQGFDGAEATVTECDSYGHATKHVLNLYEETCCPPYLLAETLAGGGVFGLYRWIQKLDLDTGAPSKNRVWGCLKGRFYLPDGGSYAFMVETDALDAEAYAHTAVVQVKWWARGGVLDPPGAYGNPHRGVTMRYIPWEVVE